MPRSIAAIRTEISEHPARSAWDKGVREYALELFNEYISEHLKIEDSSVEIGGVTEKELLNGAEDWSHYSYGGCALCYDEEICERLCTESHKKRTHNRAYKPVGYNDWLDMQRSALERAARIVLRAANRRV